jgi:hypothetical protein
MAGWPLQEGLEVTAEEVGAARGGASEGREDEVVVLPEKTRGKSFLVLARPVAF